MSSSSGSITLSLAPLCLSPLVLLVATEGCCMRCWIAARLCSGIVWTRILCYLHRLSWSWRLDFDPAQHRRDMCKDCQCMSNRDRHMAHKCLVLPQKNTGVQCLKHRPNSLYSMNIVCSFADMVHICLCTDRNFTHRLYTLKHLRGNISCSFVGNIWGRCCSSRFLQMSFEFGQLETKFRVSMAQLDIWNAHFDLFLEPIEKFRKAQTRILITLFLFKREFELLGARNGHLKSVY